MLFLHCLHILSYLNFLLAWSKRRLHPSSMTLSPPGPPGRDQGGSNLCSFSPQCTVVSLILGMWTTYQDLQMLLLRFRNLSSPSVGYIHSATISQIPAPFCHFWGPAPLRHLCGCFWAITIVGKSYGTYLMTLRANNVYCLDLPPKVYLCLDGASALDVCSTCITTRFVYDFLF